MGQCMVKKIRLLGMELDNFSLREEVLQGENFYNKTELNVIRTISMKMLSDAADNQLVRNGLAQADLLVVGDKEILTEAGIYSSQRLREAVEHGFMQEYLKRMSNNRRRVFLVAPTEEEMSNLREYLLTAYENMQLVGNYVLEACDGEYDIMVNEMNAALPDVIISVLDSPQEDGVLQQVKAKIDARVWYSLGSRYFDPEGKLSFIMWFQQLLHKGRFKNVVHHYDDEKE